MSKQYLQTYTLPNAHPTDIFSIALTPTHLLTASGSSSIKIYSLKGQTIHNDSTEEENPYPLIQTLERVHKLGCHHVCASLDGQMAASVGFAGEVKVWTLDQDEGQWREKGTILEASKQAGEHWAPALDETGQYLAVTTYDGRVHVYDTSTLTPDSTSPPTEIATYETKGSFGTAIAISPDGELTACGHQNGTISLFNNTTRRLSHSLSPPTASTTTTTQLAPIRTLRFSPGSSLLAAGGDARSVALYDARTGAQVALLAGHGAWITGLAWSPAGDVVLSGAVDGRAKVWSVDRRECVATLTAAVGVEGKAVWTVGWIGKEAGGGRSERFVCAGAGGALAFYREASGT